MYLTTTATLEVVFTRTERINGQFIERDFLYEETVTVAADVQIVADEAQVGELHVLEPKGLWLSELSKGQQDLLGDKLADAAWEEVRKAGASLPFVLPELSEAA